MSPTVTAKVREFMEDNFLFGDDDEQLDDNESLLERGLIDSTGVLQLVAFIETEFGIEMRDAEIVPENLDSVELIVRYVVGKLGGTPITRIGNAE